MCRLHPELLDDFSPLTGQAGDFHATVKARGLYNTFHFVLRLSPAVHRKLESLPSGIVTARHIDLEELEAFSTYLHETIHWWQHVGSTYGLMLSLTYPTQAHGNYNHLRQLINELGFQKSVRDLAEKLPGGGAGTPSGLVNLIINNHFDMDAFRGLTMGPRFAQPFLEKPQFENVAHAFEIAWANNLLVLSSVSDTGFKIIPHPKEWHDPIRLLRDAKEEGFYYGSPVTLPPIGALELFEGQARMAQLQYLHFSTGGSVDFDDPTVVRMLEGVYGRAFDCFLKFAELSRPATINDPIVALFLLVCDIAMNTGSGLPFPLVHFPSLISDIDPGMRFIMLCRMIHLKCTGVAGAIRRYSREEYEQVSQELCGALVAPGPIEIANEFCRWADAAEFCDLMNQHATFEYGHGNVVPRVLFSHFLHFMRDKSRNPEFFCWPGAWMAGERVTEKSAELFNRHGALYTDRADDDGIFPRLLPDRDQVYVQETFERFYASNVTYDLTRQWITESGIFRYDYEWLSQSGSREDIEIFARRQFNSVYGVDPADANLVEISS